MESIYFSIQDNIQEITKLLSFHHAFQISSMNKLFKLFVYQVNNHSGFPCKYLDKYTNLISVHINRYCDTNWIAINSKIKTLTNLQELILDSQEKIISENNSITLNELTSIKKLYLNLRYCNINISKLNQLTYLKFGKCDGKIKVPKKLTSLIILEKHYRCRMFDYSAWTNIQILSVMSKHERNWLSNLKRLQRLKLSFYDLSSNSRRAHGIHLHQFELTILKHLTSLNMNTFESEYVNDDMNKIGKLTNLLELSVNFATNTMEYLRNLTKLTRLKLERMRNYKLDGFTNLKVLKLLNPDYMDIDRSKLKSLEVKYESWFKAKRIIV